MDKKNIFLTTIFLVAFASTAFAALPSVCSAPNDIRTITYLNYTLGWSKAIWQNNNFPNFIDCFEYNLTINATINYTFNSKYLDSWEVLFLDSNGTQLCKLITNDTTKKTCNVQIKKGEKLFVVFKGYDLSNHAQFSNSANGFDYSLTLSSYSAPILTCSSGWKCQDIFHTGYQNSDCSWNNVSYCENQCDVIYGQCIIPHIVCSTGQNCKDESYLGIRNSDCSWDNLTFCKYGCNDRTSSCYEKASCSTGWKCKDASHTGWQNADCSWQSIDYCEYGCSNKNCNSPPEDNQSNEQAPTQIASTQTCSAGYKCQDSTSRGYQNEDCAWTMVTGCQWGCLDGECKSAPNNQTNLSAKEKKPTIKTIYKSPTVDAGFLASYEWSVSGSYSETGIEYAYAITAYSTPSNWIKKVATKNSNNTYR